ncbi:hypothetical protein MCP1_190056 [Candidatus Terasakiella magnetica]|nr:hypothetical protein MCP1_190056 [Candidatus Terasakiella magnetica]
MRRLGLALFLVIGASACTQVPVATLPLIRAEDIARENALLSLPDSERLGYLSSQGVTTHSSVSPIGHTIREVWPDGREVVTFFSVEGQAFLRPADDSPRSESSPPAYGWKAEGDAIVNTETGEATLYVGKGGINLWALSPDGANLRRFEEVGLGDFTWARAIPRTVAARTDLSRTEVPDLPDEFTKDLKLGIELPGKTRPEATLRQNGYRQMKPEEIFGRTLETIGWKIRARTYYGSEGVSRSRTSLSRDGVVYQSPVREFGNRMLREDKGIEVEFWTRDGRTGFSVTNRHLTGDPPTVTHFIVVGEGNFVDGWRHGRDD